MKKTASKSAAALSARVSPSLLRAMDRLELALTDKTNWKMVASKIAEHHYPPRKQKWSAKTLQLLYWDFSELMWNADYRLSLTRAAQLLRTKKEYRVRWGSETVQTLRKKLTLADERIGKQLILGRRIFDREQN